MSGGKSYAVLDVETTISNSGHPFTKTNKLCAVGLKDSDGLTVYNIEHGSEPYYRQLAEIKERLERASYVVGFNIKFDLHWIRRYIHDIRIDCVFDGQLAEFILGNQTNPFPALAAVAAGYAGLRPKLDRVQREYWSLGIDTPEVPWPILEEYCAGDVELTDQLHLRQRDRLQGNKKKLFFLQCKDLLILEEMEWNGLKYDLQQASVTGQKLQAETEAIDAELRGLVDHPCVDLGSSDHLSVVLYGGTIYEDYREQYTRTLKDGTVRSKERWSTRPVVFNPLTKPLARTETKPTKVWKEDELREVNKRRIEEGKNPFCRIYSVAEPVLTKLKLNKKAARIVELILKKSRNHKLNSTYYEGLVKKHEKMQWEPDTLHGQFNQCAVVTGRLSASEPNQQNFDKEIKALFYSRYRGAK